MVDNKKILVKSGSYVRNVSANGSECELAIKKIDAPFNILGSAATLDYYVTYDLEQNTMQFAPH